MSDNGELVIISEVEVSVGEAWSLFLGRIAGAASISLISFSLAQV